MEVDTSIEEGYSAKVSDLERGSITNFTSEQIPERVLDSIYIWIDKAVPINKILVVMEPGQNT